MDKVLALLFYSCQGLVKRVQEHKVSNLREQCFRFAYGPRGQNPSLWTKHGNSKRMHLNNEEKMESICNFSKLLLSVSLPQVKINLLNASQPCQKSPSARGQVF